MTKIKLFLIFTIILFFGAFNKSKAQQNNIAIVLNEYCMSNYAISDNYGYTSDWVEILNAHTSSVTLAGYYLSNDRNNLYKWSFPASFTLASNGIGAVYLSGRNESKKVGVNWYHHANFNIDQCKNQWLILTTPQGVIRDSVFVQKTKVGHSRGRIDINNMGVNAWAIYTTHSFTLGNPTINYYKDYLPMPTFTPAAGWNQNGQTLDMFLNGSNVPYNSNDTMNCYEIHYTTNGSYPTILDPVYTHTDNPIIILENQMFRAVTYPKSTPGSTYTPKAFCFPELTKYLPSFCQTNTYFSESTGSFDAFDSRFGILSVAIHSTDTNWFSTTGSTEPTVHVEYFDNKNQVLEGYGSLYRPVNESWMTAQRGFYVSIDDRRGFGCNFEGNIFNEPILGTTSRNVFPTLHVKSGDYESHSRKNTGSATDGSAGTGIRDIFMHSLAIKNNIKVNPLHIKPLILFINGNYRGVYDLREVYDKYFEAYYNGQSKDSLYLQQFHGVLDSYVYHPNDATTGLPYNSPLNKFRTEVFDYANTRPMNSQTFYNTLMSRLDKESFIDYMILNSYAMNSDIWNNNIAFAKGTTISKPGNKWHYYLWNTPSVFNYNAINTNTLIYSSPYVSPCLTHTATYAVSALAGNGHGIIMNKLMNPITGNPSFQLDYKNRYQDLLNTAFKCDNILSHYDRVVELFQKELRFHEDPGSAPSGSFTTIKDEYDTMTFNLRKVIDKRCGFMSTAFSLSGCYNMYGPYPIMVDVFPADAGKVKLNSIVLPNYVWNGQYYSTQIDLKAIPSSTNYVFHHWELKNHVTKHNAPLSLDSVAIDFNQPEEVIAVFTDVTLDIDMPTGFTPNGDNNNDVFKPLGSAMFSSEYDFRIWNRWGQEVFRSTDPSVGWDGNFEGKQAQTGVYAYVITYKNVFNEAKIKKGNVTLVR